MKTLLLAVVTAFWAWNDAAPQRFERSYITLRPFIPESDAFYKARNRSRDEHSYKCNQAAVDYFQAVSKAGYRAWIVILYDNRQRLAKGELPELHVIVKINDAYFDPANDIVYGYKFPKNFIEYIDPYAPSRP